MKKYSHAIIFYLTGIISVFVVSIQAQEVNIPTIITGKIGLNPETQRITYFGGTDSLFVKDTITVGSKIPIVDTIVTYSIGYTRFQPTQQMGSANVDARVTLSIKPKSGFSFTLNRISFDCIRYGTDGGLISVVWRSAYYGDSITLAKAIKPARNNSGAGTHFDSTYTTLSIPAYPGINSLDFFIYSLGTTKQVGLANIVLYGNIKNFAGDDTSGKAPTKITWGIPQSIIYGTPLNAEQLNAVAVGNTSEPVYDPASGTILTAGEHNLKVTFPADSKYSSSNATVSIQVLKATSKIIWENPEPITEGTALSSEQLNATITGSTGEATYTPPIGTVLSAGIHSLLVSFEADANYVQATKSVSIEVTGSQSISGLSDKDILVYPNPAHNELIVAIQDGIQNVKMTLSSFEGKVLLLEDLKQPQNVINIEELPAGIYFLQAITQKGIVTQKFIKK